MTDAPEVYVSVSADGRKVAEAEVADAGGAQALLEAAREAGARLAWAHSQADLSALGYRRVPGYRRLTGQTSQAGPAAGPEADPGVTVLAPEDDAPRLWAEAFAGQWGHKTPERWPPDLPAGTITLCLCREGEVAGLCRVEPQSGLIDAPGLRPGDRDPDGYGRLLMAALAFVPGPDVTVESWGEPPELTAVAESIGLTTAEYEQGWELELPA